MYLLDHGYMHTILNSLQVVPGQMNIYIYICGIVLAVLGMVLNRHYTIRHYALHVVCCAGTLLSAQT